jgi:glutamate-1-semialdehyde 2,1-aminomutase
VTTLALKNATLDDDLEAALTSARERYTLENPKSAAQQETSKAYMPGGNTRSVLYYAPFPLAFVKGEGNDLWSADGARYTDFLGEYTAGLYGHSHPKIIEAIREALDGGLNFGGQGVKEARLAELITERFPSIDLVRFTNSGTEANLMAMAAAKAITGRKEILVFHGAYHGGVFTFAFGDAPLNAPHEFVLARYNDLGGTQRLIREHAGTLAAIVIEPMLGAGGSIPATQAFLSMLREETEKVGALLIFDEVMTSRLSPGGLQAVHGINPDLTSLGKYLAGGMSFGAFGGRRALMERFDPSRPDAFFHAGTFNNNVLSMAAGVAGLESVFTPEAAVSLNLRGDALRDVLNSTFRGHGVAMQALGYGSLMTIHATADKIASPEDLSTSNQAVKELLFFDLIADGFWIARRGMVSLSLTITDDDCAAFAGAVEAFVKRRIRLLPS